MIVDDAEGVSGKAGGVRLDDEPLYLSFMGPVRFPMTALTLYTFQDKTVADILEKEERYVPEWSMLEISENERLAYRYAASFLRPHGRTGDHPPVWSWQTTPDQLPDLARSLLSLHDLETKTYMTLTLLVPAEQVIRSSYHGWCDVLFQCIETGRTPEALCWQDWQSVDVEAGDVVQALLPHIMKVWVDSVSPLAIQT